MALELFKEKNNVLHYYEGKSVAIASIYRSGHLTLNKVACVKYQLPKYRFVEIYYDKETQDIGLKFMSEQTEFSYVGRQDSSKGKTLHRGYQFQCKAFFGLIGYHKNYSQRFEIFEDGDLYKFNLSKPLGGQSELAESFSPKKKNTHKKNKWFQ